MRCSSWISICCQCFNTGVWVTRRRACSMQHLTKVLHSAFCQAWNYAETKTRRYFLYLLSVDVFHYDGQVIFVLGQQGMISFYITGRAGKNLLFCCWLCKYFDVWQTADSISMIVDTIRTVSDRVNYCDDEPTLNVVVIRQLVAENNVRVLLIDWCFPCGVLLPARNNSNSSAEKIVKRTGKWTELKLSMVYTVCYC